MKINALQPQQVLHVDPVAAVPADDLAVLAQVLAPVPVRLAQALVQDPVAIDFQSIE